MDVIAKLNSIILENKTNEEVKRVLEEAILAIEKLENKNYQNQFIKKFMIKN